MPKTTKLSIKTLLGSNQQRLAWKRVNRRNSLIIRIRKCDNSVYVFVLQCLLYRLETFYQCAEQLHRWCVNYAEEQHMLQECDTDLTSQYKTIFCLFVILFFCLFVQIQNDHSLTHWPTKVRHQQSAGRSAKKEVKDGESLNENKQPAED